ncbi:MAG: SMP-30/gluconolactonase/LRE family protein [Planctomycetaceae bacterium]|nr:SMP-30/gluconolactonase/LRE family protein [Planctomycetaceae bacterium]
MRRCIAAAVCLFVAVSSSAVAREPQLQLLWNEGEFTEGVAVRSDGMVFFSDIARDPDVPGRILMFDPRTAAVTVYSADSRKSNGLYFDSQDRLWACCGANGGAMALCRVSADGAIIPVVETFNGRRLNSPNDLVVLSDDTIYFSDPRYVGPEPIELDHQSVFHFNPQTKVLTRATTGIEKPNGVHVSPDERRVYVAETNNGSTGQGSTDSAKMGRMTLNVFDRDDQGALSGRRVLKDFGKQTGIDGMTVAADGHLWAAVRSEARFGIAEFDENGKELFFVATPELPTNCCFGTGAERDVLYVTAGGGFYRLRPAD